LSAIVQALAVLEGDDESVARALAPFDAMVETQLEHAKRGLPRHVKRHRPPRRHALRRLLVERCSRWE
jgi:hypothetical protein